MGEHAPAAAPPLFNTVLLLFRKDLRVYDNPALLAASQAAKHVVSCKQYTATDSAITAP